MFVTVLTHILPAGEYVRFEDPATGQNIIDPASYAQVESTPVGVLKMLTAIPNGFEQAAQIVALTFCVSGTFHLITSAGLIPALLKSVSHRFSDRGIIVVPLLLLIISLLDCFWGSSLTYERDEKKRKNIVEDDDTPVVLNGR